MTTEKIRKIRLTPLQFFVRIKFLSVFRIFFSLLKGILMKYVMIITLIFVYVLGIQATSIIGGSSIISTSHVLQLESWLGESNLALTKIFSKYNDGASSSTFHSKVDNKGRTFTLMQIINGSDVRIVGGYNSLSWLSNASYNYSAAGSFLFNLTSSTLYANSRFNYYTYNHTDYGPTWGGGHDLYINSTLSGGYANIGHTYGDYNQYNTTSYQNSFTGSYSSWSVGELEVFTISQDIVPEPASMILLGMAIAILWNIRKR